MDELPPVLAKFDSLLRQVCNDEERLRKSIPISDAKNDNGGVNEFILWVDRIEARACINIQDAATECASFATAALLDGEMHAIIFLGPSDDRCKVPETYIALVNFKGIHQEDNLDDDDDESVATPILRRDWIHGRKKKRPCPSTPIILTIIIVAMFTGLVAFVLMKPTSKWPEDGYIQYPTPGSVGPKRQSRLYYYNATEWARENPHQNGEWRIRMDDQALIPAELWDEDEDFYQAWYYERYPHLRKIIQQRKYMRPSWLGSLDIMVPWDYEFHFNHCVSKSVLLPQGPFCATYLRSLFC